MHFSNKLEDDEEYIVVEASKLDNNILLCKEKLDKNIHYIVKLKENQSAILFEKGQIYDMIKEEGVYTIRLEPNNYFLEDLIEYNIKDNNDNLSIIFFNMNVITNNKFYIKKKYKNEFFGEGTFEFKIDNTIKFFNKVIDVRTFYTREELVEQIRERISKNVIRVLKDCNSEYIIDNETLNSNLDIFKDYGIKIISSDIKDIQFKKK